MASHPQPPAPSLAKAEDEDGDAMLWNFEDEAIDPAGLMDDDFQDALEGDEQMVFADDAEGAEDASRSSGSKARVLFSLLKTKAISLSE